MIVFMRKWDGSDQKLAEKLDLKKREQRDITEGKKRNHFEVSCENKTT